jgi:hypothetical protein
LRCQSVNQLLHELYVKEIRTTRKKTVKEEKKRTKDGIQRATGKLMGIRMVIMTRMKRAEGRDLGQKGSRKEVWRKASTVAAVPTSRARHTSKL